MRSVEHLWWRVKGGFGFSKFGRFGDLVDFAMRLVGCKMKICMVGFWMNFFKEISYWDIKKNLSLSVIFPDIFQYQNNPKIRTSLFIPSISKKNK